MLRRLDRTIPEGPGRPDLAGPDHPMRKVTQQIAAGGGWDTARASKVRTLFDGLASEWNERISAERLDPVADALDRGALPDGGRCAELGSGTGSATPLLASAFGQVVCLDLAWEMLVRARAQLGARVQADAERLPLRTGSVDAVVLVNTFLFPAEVDRVLAGGGHVVWVSTLGDRTPIYLAPDVALEALPGRWTGVTSVAGWGEWLVARRAATRPSAPTAPL